MSEQVEQAQGAQEGGLRKATVDLEGDRAVRIERIFDAPREKVFRAMTDPELIPRWWGPHRATTIVDKMDVREGGEWRFVHRMDDGTEHGFRGIYRELKPPERIVQTFEWEGMPGYISLEVGVLEDLGDGTTKFTSTSHFFTPEERDGTLQSGMEAGMQETYQRLDEVLAQTD